MKYPLNLKKSIFLPLGISFLLFSFLIMVASCNITPIFAQIVNEKVLLNGNINDKATPSFMTEDDDHLYVLMNRPYWAKKMLVYPKGFLEEGVEKLPPEDDSRIILAWQELDNFSQTIFAGVPLNSLSCRGIFAFNGIIYASFANDSLAYQTSESFDNYSQIFKLKKSDDGTTAHWIESGIPLPNIFAPKRGEEVSANINPNTDRLFGYSEDFSGDTEDVVAGYSPEEKNSYLMARYFDTNQIRRPEAVKFFNIKGNLYILFSDTYLKERDESSSISFGRNPIFRLYKANNLGSSPSLELVEIKNDRGNSTTLLSEKSLLEKIKIEMGSGLNFGEARYKVVLAELFVLAGEGASQNFLDSAGKGWHQAKKIYLQHSFASIFTRHFTDVSSKELLFNGDGLFELNTTSLALTEITEKLPFGVQIVNGNFIPIDPGSYTPPVDDGDLTEEESNQFTRYRLIDFYLYEDENDAQHLAVAMALSTADRQSKRSHVATYNGGIDSVTAINWRTQQINTYNVSTTDRNLLTVPTCFSYYNNYSTAPGTTYPVNYPITAERRINRLLMGSTNGFYGADPSPGGGAADFDGPQVDKAGATNISYEDNILSISLASSYILDFYPTTAIVKNGEEEFNVSILFALTAGNGLWINYNKFWNRE